MKKPHAPSILTAAVLGFAALTTNMSAESVTTTPVGYTTISINGGTGTSYEVTPIALPLHEPAVIDGASSGVIESLTADSISVASAGWVAGSLSNVAEPFIFKITSGNAEGRCLLVSSAYVNTADTVVVDLATSNVEDLTSLGIVAGVDTFEIINCDTLSSLFGGPSDGVVIGGATSREADNIWILRSNGIWAKYYYNTSSGWVENVRGNPDASNVALLPTSGVLYWRKDIGSSQFVLTGTVPSTNSEMTINSSGFSLVANVWPTDVTLSSAGFSGIPEWGASSDPSSADMIKVRSGGIWRDFFYDGVNWREASRGYPVQDSFIIPAGAAVLVEKINSSVADVSFDQMLPYSL